jgi:hypothetical protein
MHHALFKKCGVHFWGCEVTDHIIHFVQFVGIALYFFYHRIIHFNTILPYIMKIVDTILDHSPWL